jgi:membrane-anchored protein YejM (alkaline phosphatase superfamily)
MNQSSKLIRMSVALAVLCLVAMVFSFLAISDIAHGEEDVMLEWAILRVTALLILMFIALTLVTLWRISRELRKLRTTDRP